MWRMVITYKDLGRINQKKNVYRIQIRSTDWITDLDKLNYSRLVGFRVATMYLMYLAQLI